MEDLHPYRAPMVTATGIFLGFMLLNFTSGWIKDAFAKNIFKDVVVAIGVTICLASLLTVLFRILRMHYPTEPDKFYRRTLLFIYDRHYCAVFCIFNCICPENSIDHLTADEDNKKDLTSLVFIKK